MKRYFGTGRLRLWTWMFMSMRLGFATLLALMACCAVGSKRSPDAGLTGIWPEQ